MVYNYTWDPETGGYLLDSKISGVTKELRPVFHEELDLLGFNNYWEYKNTDKPLLWAEMRRYFYQGELVAEAKGGGLFSKPTLHIYRNSLQLVPVNVKEMVNRNKTKMSALVQNTVEAVYNEYNYFKSKVEVVCVAFSGGKDSVVLLDLVQKTLPHDTFKVVFADTTMEISDTYEAVKKAKEIWPTLNFYTAKSHMDATETWRLFAPPAKIQRWCCAVHKSVPSLLLLRDIVKSKQVRALVYDGIRSEESDARATYTTISNGHKHSNQINCSPIIGWGTDELFLYILEHNLMLNKAYRYGSTRVGCALCPMSSPWRDFITYSCYQNDIKEYIEIIKEYAKNTGISDIYIDDYLQKSGWRTRAGGRGLAESSNLVIKNYENTIQMIIKNHKSNWKEWIKTIGNLTAIDSDNFSIEYNDIRYGIACKKKDILEITVSGLNNGILDKRFSYCIRNIFGKTAYCVACKACEVECPTGALTINNHEVKISSNCTKCELCLEKPRGCLAAKSFYSTIGGKNMSNLKGMNRYGTFGFRSNWFKSLQQIGFKDFWLNDKLGPDQYDGFKKWLIDAEIIHQHDLTRAGQILLDISADSTILWGIITVNISYNSVIFNWYINNTEFLVHYKKSDYVLMINEKYPEIKRERTISNALNSLINTLAESPIGEQLGLGVCTKKGKSVSTITRVTWKSPEPVVILYALYKFAEKCDGHYGFTLSYLCDNTIERSGISPAQLFGLTAEKMKEILISLSRDYSDLVSVNFQKDLDNIDLRKDKTSIDVLQLL